MNICYLLNIPNSHQRSVNRILKRLAFVQEYRNYVLSGQGSDFVTEFTANSLPLFNFWSVKK